MTSTAPEVRPQSSRHATEANFKSFSTSNFFSRLFFLWVYPLVRLGVKQDLGDDDVFEMDEKSDPETLYQDFWEIKSSRSYSTLRSLTVLFQRDLFLSGLLFLLSVCLRFVGPFLLGLIVTFISQHQQGVATDISLEMCYGCAILLCLAQILGSLCHAHAGLYSLKVGINIRSVLAASTFAHVLNLSALSQTHANDGLVMSLVSTDSLVFLEFVKQWNQIWTAPFVLIAGIVYIQVLIGVSVWAGMSILILFVPISWYLGKAQTKWQRQKMNYTDSRVKLCNEVLSSIRVVKFNVWEQALEERMQALRMLEFQNLRGLEYVRALSGPFAMMVPNIASVLTFVTYVSLSNTLTAASTFSVISLFVIIRTPFVVLPLAINQIARLIVALKRFDDFFALLPRHAKMVNRDIDVVSVEPESAFAWTMDRKFEDFQLHVPHGVQIPQGSLVICHGAVASGKTSFLLALAQEMQLVRGDKFAVLPSCRMAYCSQEPFILNASVRDNILFGQAMDDAWYAKVLQGVGLVEEINQLPGGDMCEIGTKGLNLSGGQKARLALARAFYSQPDLLLLDDPLAALDARLSKRIFHFLASQVTCTRVLVTNNLHLLKHADMAVELVQGVVGKQYLPALSEGQVEEDNVEENHSLEMISEVDSKAAFAQLTTVETRALGQVSKKVLWLYWLSGSHGSYVKIFLLLILFGLAEAIFLAVDAFLAQQTSTVNPLSTAEFILVYSLLTVGSIAGILIRAFSFAHFHLNATQNLYTSAVKNIFRLPMSFYWKEPTGRMLNRFSFDQNSIDTQLGQAWLWLLLTLVRVVGILCLIIVAVPIFAPVIVPLFLLYYFIRSLYRRSARDLQRIVAVSQSPLMQRLTETLHGKVTLSLFPSATKAWWMEKLFADLTYSFQAKFSCDVLSDCWLSLYLEILGALVILVTGLIIVGLRDSVSSGFAGLALAYALNIVINLNASVRQAVLVEQLMNGVERLNEYAECEAEKDLVGSLLDSPRWPQSGGLVFEHVSMKYRPEVDTFALHDLNLSFASGEHAGIVGKSGGGKSSLFVALLRLVDVSHGRILLDHQDLSQVPKQWLRSKVVVVPQEAVVFKQTLRYNVDPFQHYTDAQVWQALRDANIQYLAEATELKLDVMVGEISVGERALICMARAVLRSECKLVLLDEASSALDSQTDLLIQRTIRAKFQHATLLMIAHRLDTVIDLDSIVVIGEGRLVEKGSAWALLEQVPESAFAKLVKETGKESANELKSRSQRKLM